MVIRFAVYDRGESAYVVLSTYDRTAVYRGKKRFVFVGAYSFPTSTKFVRWSPPRQADFLNWLNKNGKKVTSGSTQEL